ncbi:MAG TPA: hypothetical protein PKD70_02290 [Saprospiraceae bacterium]|nr:hypothetical protein [Saprospiraceae bacterium]HMP12681.1 hypothetical protein [Saprospiraceae bacterium]
MKTKLTSWWAALKATTPAAYGQFSEEVATTPSSLLLLRYCL